MKFMMNGALTIGTLDGANVEIRDLVGDENFFLFGRTEDRITEMQNDGYNPSDFIGPDLQEALDLVTCGHFSGGDRYIFKPLLDNLLKHDPFFVMADFDDYRSVQGRVSEAWKDKDSWNRKALINISRSGFFSSDRSIRDYCTKIWGM